MYVRLLSNISKMEPKSWASVPILLYTLPMAITALPLCVVFFAVYGFYRSIILLLKTILRPDLENPLDDLTQAFTSNWYGNSDPVITQIFIVEGRVSVEGLLEELHQKLMTDPSFEKLFKFPVNFGGYYFWKDEADFKLENHCKKLGNHNIIFLKEDLQAHLEQLALTGWKDNQSPWEVSVVNNYSENPLRNQNEDKLKLSSKAKEKSVVILRVHQCYHDIYQQILGPLEQNLQFKINSQKEMNQENSLWTSSLEKFSFPFFMIHDLLKLRMSMRVPMEAYDQYDEQSVTVKNYSAVFAKLNFAEIKQIAHKLGVHSDSVLQGILTTFLHRVVKSAGYSYDNLSVSLDSIFCSVTELPRSSHVLENVRDAESMFKDVATSTIPKAWYSHQRVVGFLPTFCHGRMIYQPKVSVARVQGSRRPVKLNGLDVLDVFRLGNYPGDSEEGISILTYLYNKEIALTLSAFNMYFPREVLQDFQQLVDQEMGNLKRTLRM